ncbi:MAG: MurR/RpiR family transcriptional regulator [Solobacterium sp.]|nr:MurR/RpiR family transcriptional regulator [Solobacterium sp.]
MMIIKKIESLTRQSNSGTAGVIGRYVLENRTDFFRCPTKEISAKLSVSKSALVRFAQKLGFDGWRDFIFAYVNELQYVEAGTDIDPDQPFGNETDIKKIVSNLAGLKVDSILETADLIQTEEVEAAARLIHDARRVGLFTMGPNSPNILIGATFARKMMDLGRQIYVPWVDDQKTVARGFGEHDCAIIVSYKGRSYGKDTDRMLEHMREQKVPVIAVTGADHSELYDLARIRLTICSAESPFKKIAPFMSEAAIMYVFDLLYAVYFMIDYSRNADYKDSIDITLESVWRQNERK